MSGPKAIFFDLDDTLIDHGGAVYAALREVYTLFPEPPAHVTLDFFVSIWRSKERHHYQDLLQGKKTPEQMRFDRLTQVLETCGFVLTAGQIRALDAHYLREYCKYWRLFDDVLPCLLELSSYKLGIITNGQSMQQSQKIEQTRLNKHIKHVVISEQVGSYKPQADIFIAAAKSIGVPLERCVLLGDSMESDYLGAEAVGMFPILLMRPTRLVAPGVPFTTAVNSLNSLAELPLFLDLFNEQLAK